MINLTGVSHHPAVTDLVDVICSKTRNTNKSFFRAEVAYFLGKMASCMRATIVTKDRGDVPVNIYALALANSGFGKGHSVNIIEDDFMKGFKRRFLTDTMTVASEANLWVIANERAIRNNSDPQAEYDVAAKEYRDKGAYPFTFDSATVPAVKQLREKLLLANCGSVNLQIDEIGSNLVGAVDTLTLFLELYDQGLVKPKLIKNSAENKRSEEVEGKTPTNMLLFGTPAKLFDGGQTEEQFYSMLEIGYARRCIFGMGVPPTKPTTAMTAAEVYARLLEPNNKHLTQKWSAHFHTLADPAMFGWEMSVEDDVAIKLIEYQMDCEEQAANFKDTSEIKAAELSHRHNKALKLAGAFAFIDQSNEVEMEHLMQAILLIEGSGEAFNAILTRERPYERLAKYIASNPEELTHPDLTAALPFYKGNASVKSTMMGYAIAWGYKNNIIIKKTFGANNIEFFKGETLKETNLDEMKISYSDNFAYNYLFEEVPFKELHTLTQAANMHWANHGFKNQHRAEENVIPGFNMLVLDVDGGISLNMVHELLKDIVFMIYTTKRHTEEDHRFRLIIPTNYILELDTSEYKEMVNDVIAWLPFKASVVDTASNQRSKKWMTCDTGRYYYNMEAELFNILPFIPKTSQNEVFKKDMKSVESMDNLERWFASRMDQGNRNNNMLKYALALVDSGMDFFSVENAVLTFNKKILNPLDEQELSVTVMRTVAKKYS